MGRFSPKMGQNEQNWVASPCQKPAPLVISCPEREKTVMRNILSLLIGAVALILAAIAFIPLLGWANWIIIPLAIIGLGLGATSDKTSGRNLNIVVVAIGALRLFIGGGFI
jgi:hypothetical protein